MESCSELMGMRLHFTKKIEFFRREVNLPPSFFDCDLKGHRAPYRSGREDGRMDVLEIRYENGHMTIYVPVFFPCTQENAKKIFKLIKQYCSEEDRVALGRYLYLVREFLRAQMETGDGFSGVPPDWDYGLNYISMDPSERRSLFRKAEANYKWFCRMEVDNEWMR